MARLLVRLKLRLLRNALYSSTAAKASFLVSTAFAVLTAIGTFVVPGRLARACVARAKPLDGV